MAHECRGLQKFLYHEQRDLALHRTPRQDCLRGGGGLPYKEDRGARRKLWKEASRGTKILFCGCGLKCFSAIRGTKILFCGCGLKCFHPLRGTKILFCGCGLKCFSALRGTNFKTTYYFLSYFFRLNTLLKRSIKLPLRTFWNWTPWEVPELLF